MKRIPNIKDLSHSFQVVISANIKKKKGKGYSYRQSHTGPETGPKKKYSVHATLDSDGMKTSVGMVKSNILPTK